MFGILSSRPALWHAVDALPYFRWSGLKGWLLTAIQSVCFSFQIVQVEGAHLPRSFPSQKLSKSQ